MEPTTLLLVAAFLAPVPSTNRQSPFSAKSYSEYSVVPTVLATTQTVKQAPATLETELLATDVPTSLQSSIEKEIASYAELSDDWDEEGGRAPSMETIISAELIAKYVPPAFKAKVMVSSSGAISLYWDHLGGYAEVGVDLDQSCYFFARDPNGRETFLDTLSVAEVASREWLSRQLEEMYVSTT